MTVETKRAGVDVRIAAIVAIVLVLAFGGAAAWAYTTNQDLERTRQSLATTSGTLETTKSTLSDTQGQLTSTTADVASEQAAIEADTSKIKVLEFQVQRRGACIAAQTANLAELRRILELERANFARGTSTSAWGKAHAASDKALDLAIDYLQKSYLAAAAGNYSSANSWLSKSNAQVRASNKQIAIGNKEIDKLNAASDAINAANDAFAETLKTTSSTCGA
jgi:septal ring factor EnvC (AmiA/AmiB activator)